MPRNGSGIYNLPAGNPVTPATVVRSDWANTTMNDLAAALSGSLAKDGQTVATGNQNMGGYRHTNVGAAQTTTGYTRADQTQKQLLNTLSSVAGADTITATLALGTVSFTPGMFIIMVPVATNTGPVTLSINASAPAPIITSAADPLPAGKLVSGVPTALQWDGTAWRTFGGATNATDITDALGYVPVNKAGDTMAGPLTTLALTITGAFKLTAAGGAAAFYGYNYQGVPVNGTSISRFYGLGMTPSAGDKVAGGIEVVTNENWTDAANGSIVNIRAIIAGGIGLQTVASFNGLLTTFNSPLNFNRSNVGQPTQGGMSFGDGTGNLHFDGVSFTLSGGQLIVGSGISTKSVAMQPLVATIGGGTALDFNSGQSQILTLSAAASVTFNNIPNGSIMRATFHATNNGLTVGGVLWPNGTLPSFDSGPNKIALITVENSGGTLLGNFSAY